MLSLAFHDTKCQEWNKHLLSNCDPEQLEKMCKLLSPEIKQQYEAARIKLYLSQNPVKSMEKI